MTLINEGDPAERSRAVFNSSKGPMPPPPEDVSPEVFQAGLEAYDSLQKEGLIEGPNVVVLQPSERRAQRHEEIRQIARTNPQMLAGDGEEGVVIPKARKEKTPKPRAEDSVTGKEVVVQSRKQPIKIAPPLDTSTIELHRHRSDVHTRMAHNTSNVIAHATGFVDGVVDGVANGVAEIVEDLAFFASKTKQGVKHGIERGKTNFQE